MKLHFIYVHANVQKNRLF